MSTTLETVTTPVDDKPQKSRNAVGINIDDDPLTRLIAETPDKLVICEWLGNAAVTLSEASLTYSALVEKITEDNIHAIAARLASLPLASTVVVVNEKTPTVTNKTKEQVVAETEAEVIHETAEPEQTEINKTDTQESATIFDTKGTDQTETSQVEGDLAQVAYDTSAEDTKGGPIIEDSFTIGHFIERLQTHAKSPIKTVLMDQRVVANASDIYVNELLSKAKIYPITPVKQIPRAKLVALYNSLQVVLN